MQILGSTERKRVEKGQTPPSNRQGIRKALRRQGEQHCPVQRPSPRAGCEVAHPGGIRPCVTAIVLIVVAIIL